MRHVLCDTGVLIAVYDQDDMHHARCIELLSGWEVRLLVPEPVLGETCNFLRNNVRNGAALEVQFLDVLTASDGDFDIVDPVSDDRARATELARQLVTGPLGYVDGIILAMAERLKVPEIATVDFKFLGMADPVSRLKPLRWVLQES